MKNPLGHAIVVVVVVVVARAGRDLLYFPLALLLAGRVRTRRGRAAAREPPSVYKRDLVAAAFQRWHARGNASFVWLNAKTLPLPSPPLPSPPLHRHRHRHWQRSLLRRPRRTQMRPGEPDYTRAASLIYRSIISSATDKPRLKNEEGEEAGNGG